MSTDRPPLLVGVDFDNTIVRYDAIFYRLALEGGLISRSAGATKAIVRAELRHAGREADWTALQGAVYGPRLAEADLFPGALDFFRRCHLSHTPVMVISHRTRYPYAGPRHDLHASAYAFLTASGICDPNRGGLPVDRVVFETTKAAKLERIARAGCTHFVDDLAELLGDPEFPPNVERLLFDPNNSAPADLDRAIRKVGSWEEAARHLLGPP